MNNNAAHFRIVMPEGLKGTLHSGRNAQLFVTFPGHPEIQVPKAWDIEGHWGMDDATGLTIRLFGSVEVEYR